MLKQYNIEEQINTMSVSNSRLTMRKWLQTWRLNMNYATKKISQKQLKQFILVSLLTAIIFSFNNLLLVETATAKTQKLSLASKEELKRDRMSENVPLSDRIAKAVITGLAKQTGIAPEKLKITQYSRQTWSNGCLGLPTGEICTQALVEGWRVVVSGNGRTWVYRSDRNGRIVRLESPPKATKQLREEVN